MLQAALSEPRRNPFKIFANSSPHFDDLVKRDYSLARVLRLGPALHDGFEFEVSRELARVHERQPAGVFVPWQVFAYNRRDLSAGIPGAGGVTLKKPSNPH